MIKKIFLLITILFFSNCRMFTGASKYIFMGTNYTIPDGTPAFKEGWKDGCENGIYTRANTFYRTRYHKFNYQPSLIDNPEYKFAYGRGYGYCFSMNTGGSHGAPGAGGADAFIYGRGAPFDMGQGNIDGTVNYETGTWNNPLNTNAGGIDGVWGAAQSPKGFSLFSSHPLYGTPNSNQIFGW